METEWFSEQRGEKQGEKFKGYFGRQMHIVCGYTMHTTTNFDRCDLERTLKKIEYSFKHINKGYDSNKD